MKLRTVFFVLVAFLGLVVLTNGAHAEELTRMELSSSGLAIQSNLTAVDAGSDTALLDDRTFLVLSDSSLESTVTISSQQVSYNTERYGNLTIPDLTINVSGDTILQVPTGYANDNGRMELSYSGDTADLKVGVFKRTRR